MTVSASSTTGWSPTTANCKSPAPLSPSPELTAESVTRVLYPDDSAQYWTGAYAAAPEP